MRQFENVGKLLIDSKLLVIIYLQRKMNIDKMQKLPKIWYDNEWGYSNKTVDLIRYIDSVESGPAKSAKPAAAPAAKGKGKK